MKKIMVSLLLIINASSFANDTACVKTNGFYIAGFGGANFKDSLQSETGYSFATALGYRWLNQFRSELEYSYRHHDSKQNFYFGDYIRNLSLKTSLHAYMFNTLWDLPVCNIGNFKPFIGGGIGVGVLNHKITLPFYTYGSHRARIKFRSEEFAWQIITGVAYPIYKNVDLSAEYRFFTLRNSIYNHSVGIGLKYYFY